MTVVLVAAAMWLLAASLLILRRGRAERNITYAALTIAVAMTLNTDPVYRLLDKLAGGDNLVTLVADVALMIGVFFLGRGVMKASERQPKAVRLALGRVALVTAILGAVVAFTLIDLGWTTTNFMLELGEQPAAAVYSMIQFVYYGIVLAAMAVLAARQFRNIEGVQKLPPASLFIGSILGVILSVVVIAMDLAHVSGELDLMAEIAVTYEPLRLLAFLFLCLGFAGQPAARTLQARSRERRTRELVDDLRPIWAEATKARPGISQNQQVAVPGDEPDTVLHRQVVEIRDAMIDTRVNFAVSEPERELIERAELHLVGAGPAISSAATSPTTTGDEKLGR
ncbi:MULTISPECIES: MAB_1171c family putative transporter [Cryobacterium]|uniref:MAB_1171c family putative transporter n=1 Tax=Cryobacterium TaxID=69578 RepID=UPI000CD3DE23|nr:MULTISPECIES: MAB_1171c family putative transporter [Cryobacterium]POH66071.1 hypothetical protein C3B60_09615 [Cryobacterium zongtaii]TFC46738.1 hypothetical protein E3O57_05755 [Cryobacterium sp. TMN-39-2]